MINKAKLSIIVLAVSIICHIIAVFQFVLNQEQFNLFWNVKPQFYIFLCLSLIFSIVMFFISEYMIFRLFLFLRFILIIIVNYPFENFIGIEFTLITVLILETCIYEPFPNNMIFSIIFSVICLYFNYPVSAWAKELPASYINDLIIFTACSLILAIAGSLVNYYRKTVVDQEEHINRLGTAVARLTKANAEFQQYANIAWEQSALDERKRLSREIHDVIGYTFTNLIMMMEAATDLAVKDPVKVDELIQKARSLAQVGFEDIRSELHSLRTIGIKKEIGLKAIHRLTQIFKESTEVAVDVEYGNLPMTFGEQIDSTMYHFIQEGITNAFKHGKATRIKVILWQENSRVRMVIQDNGSGTVEIEEGIGISGMRERFEAIGGQFTAQNISGGFELSAWLPLKEKA